MGILYWLMHKQPLPRWFCGESMCVSDKNLSVAGGVGQGTLRPTDRHTDTQQLVEKSFCELALYFTPQRLIMINELHC